ncbi:MAG TPA: T9SS type A sorting domain-containing protein [Bacteroidia bacterium]
MKKVLTLLSFIFFFQISYAQSGKFLLKGRISNLSNNADTSLKLYLYKNKVLKDSIKVDQFGIYNKMVDTGKFEIKLSSQSAAHFSISQFNVRPCSNFCNFTFGNSQFKKQETIYNNFDKSPIEVKSIKGEKNLKKVSPPFTQRSSDYDGFADFEDIKEEPRAGLITAGYWRDLDHWSEWIKTNNDPTVSVLQSQWGFNLIKLHQYTIKNLDNKVMPLVNVKFTDTKTKLVWESVSDVNGIVYSWLNLNDKNAGDEIKIELSNKNLQYKINKTGNDQFEIITDSKSQEKVMGLDLAFVVDATGSMGDEIKFLQLELVDIIHKVSKSNPCLNIRTGALFYKDEGDDYLTRTMPLTEQLSITGSFITEQTASGGGDFPEALDLALENAITQMGWSASPTFKVMILLLDAPSHYDTASKNRIKRCLQKASSMGIHIIPVAASGIDKSTEFLLKNIAIATNGEYVYITDDSKIGNGHIQPTGGRSDVKPLNDLLIEMVLKHTGEACKFKDSQIVLIDTIIEQVTEHTTESDSSFSSELVLGSNWSVLFYPNPSKDKVIIEADNAIDEILITDLNGKTVFSLLKPELSTEINTSDWSSGIYVVRVTKGDELITGKLMVMH